MGSDLSPNLVLQPPDFHLDLAIPPVVAFSRLLFLANLSAPGSGALGVRCPLR